MKQHVPNKMEVLRHSTAHLMAAAIQRLWPDAIFGIGPVVENGFYYDFEIPKKLEQDDLPKIEKEMRNLIKDGYPYEKKLLGINEAITLFKKLKQPYKVDLLKDLKTKGTTKLSKEEGGQLGGPQKTRLAPGKDGKQPAKGRGSPTRRPAKISTYVTGDFIDLCLGPHVANTRNINPRSFKLTKVAGAYWRGKETNPMLTRIYGTAFQNEQDLKKHLSLQEEIERRDHRKLGNVLNLFHFEDISPGAVFWHPKGMTIMRELEAFWREIHDKEGYLETSTPILVKKSIFEKSGHWQYYKENMFTLEIDKETYILKPMNCPESTKIYSSRLRSYKNLPIRLSEIGRLHRNERSGVLMGLSRVRQITMDDAHIYARPDQIQEELTGALGIVKTFYSVFGLKPAFFLATKPEKAMGAPSLWVKAEKALAFALKEHRLAYELKPKDGTFYGPKIDIHITDSLGRSWQMATIQLDFQMPERFGLYYIDEKGKKQKPVMIHRAIFGSFERFIGILLEDTGGALPLWLAPIQVNLIPVGSRHEAYLEKVKKAFDESRIRVELAFENETLGKKIREGELQKVPYLAVAGDNESKAKTLRIRATRKQKGKEDLGEIKVDDFIKMVREEIETKSRD